MTALRIAIDGPAASGKTTTAKAVARRLGYRYIDSGALYRAAALKAWRLGLTPEDPGAIADALRATTVGYDPDGLVILDGTREESRLRDPEISELASRLSVHAEVRAWVNETLRAEAAGGGVVMEGRDIGTVVLPDAELKVFLNAERSERARRRHHDLERAGRAATVEDVREALSRRDRRDETRNEAPLKSARDAIPIDGTAMTFEEQVQAVVDLAVERGA